MQPPTDGPRAAFTTSQVAYLIENSSSFDTSFGVELLADDWSLNVEQDVSGDVTAASVQRNSLADMHASLTLSIARPLNWGAAMVRPYITFAGPTSSAGGAATMKFYQGAYFVDTPQEDLSQVPSMWDVTGYDILSILDDPVGDVYSVDVGESYLQHVEQIFLNRGVSQYMIDQDAAASVLASPLVFAMEDNVTWLTICNSLLAAVGYQGVWSDWNGVLRAHTYTTPSLRSPEWVMTSDLATTLLTQRRKRQRDFYAAPNRWVFYRSSNTDNTQPVDGNGRYEFINQTTGPTSVEARNGRIITKVGSVDAADQASLVAAARQTIDADMTVATTIAIDTAPFPLAWHFDRLLIVDPDQLGAALDVQATSWTLNLDGSDMSWEWSPLA